MVATEPRLKLDDVVFPDDLKWVDAYVKDHPSNPEHAQAAHWKVVRDGDDVLVNVGLIISGQTLVVTDFYLEPSRRGVKAAKWFMRGVKQSIDNGSFRQLICPKTTRRVDSWWAQIFKTKPYLVNYYGGQH